MRGEEGKREEEKRGRVGERRGEKEIWM